MSELLDNVPIQLGQCIRVTNMERTKSVDGYKQDTQYVAVHIEDEDGANERCILLTHAKHTDMETVVLPTVMTSSMVFGRLYSVVLGKRSTFLLKVKHWDGNTRLLRISKSQLTAADKLAAKHPETLPVKSWLTDLMD